MRVRFRKPRLAWLRKLRSKKAAMFTAVAVSGLLLGSALSALNSGQTGGWNEPKDPEFDQTFESDSGTVAMPGDTTIDFSPRKLSVATGSKSFQAGGSTTVTVVVRDKYGLETVSGSSIVVTIAGSNGFRCSITIRAGSSVGSCRFSANSAGTVTLTASSQGLGSASTQVTVNEAPKPKEEEPPPEEEDDGNSPGNLPN